MCCQQVQKGKPKSLTKTDTKTESESEFESESVTGTRTGTEIGTKVATKTSSSCISAFHFAAGGSVHKMCCTRRVAAQEARDGGATKTQCKTQLVFWTM